MGCFKHTSEIVSTNFSRNFFRIIFRNSYRNYYKDFCRHSLIKPYIDFPGTLSRISLDNFQKIKTSMDWFFIKLSRSKTPTYIPSEVLRKILLYSLLPISLEIPQEIPSEVSLGNPSKYLPLLSKLQHGYIEFRDNIQKIFYRFLKKCPQNHLKNILWIATEVPPCINTEIFRSVLKFLRDYSRNFSNYFSGKHSIDFVKNCPMVSFRYPSAAEMEMFLS